MTYRDVLVHLDNGERSPVRLPIAVDVARRFGARLMGLFAECDPYLANLASLKPDEMYGETATRTEADLRQIGEKAEIDVDWDAVVVRRDSALASAVLAAACCSDLAVLGQHDPREQGSGVPSDLVEQVLLHSGRPVLIIPFAGDFKALGRRIMVAWNAGREASRAIHDSLPFLQQADEVTVIEINPTDEGLATRDRITKHLEAHGIAAQTASFVAEEIGAMDLLLSRVTDEAVDLLVMGAHGHYGFPHLHRGGATRHILRQMTVPVLMSH